MWSQACSERQLLAWIANLMTSSLELINFRAFETSGPLVGCDLSEKRRLIIAGHRARLPH
jgi:hypothetical protein